MGVQVPSSAPLDFILYQGKNMSLVFFRRHFSLINFLFIAMTVAGLYFVYNIKHYIRQGIDLVGGTMIVLSVDLRKAYQQALQQDVASVLQSMNEKGKAITIVSKEYHDEKAVISFTNNEDANEFYDKAVTLLTNGVVSKSEAIVEIRLDQKEQDRIASYSVDANIKALRNRLDPYGAGEILIAPQGDKIVIELPNVQDPTQARKLIGKAAHLAIKPVLDIAQTKEKLFEKYDGMLPDNTDMYPDENGKSWYLLSKDAELTGRYLNEANLQYDTQHGNRPCVQFQFNFAGGQKFRELTRECIGQALAICVDDIVISAPNVNEEIGSTGIITGNFTPQSAQELATMLKSGAFAAPVTFSQERVIGPSLGNDAVRSGLIACAVGLVLLLIASIVVYKIVGILAFLVLLYNLLFSLIGMWLIGATLTLSGIAGLILTIGMAIDASILIFERVREELNLGRNFKNAIEIGFSGAMEVIIDANITHFIIALVLYKLGAGPLKGFAVSMIVGIIATLVSGIIILRGFFRYILNTAGFSNISM